MELVLEMDGGEEDIDLPMNSADVNDCREDFLELGGWRIRLCCCRVWHKMVVWVLQWEGEKPKEHCLHMLRWKS